MKIECLIFGIGEHSARQQIVRFLILNKKNADRAGSHTEVDASGTPKAYAKDPELSERSQRWIVEKRTLISSMGLAT
jgi:hypothetical protein